MRKWLQWRVFHGVHLNPLVTNLSNIPQTDISLFIFCCMSLILSSIFIICPPSRVNLNVQFLLPYLSRYVNGINSILMGSIPVLGGLLSPVYFQFFLDKVSGENMFAAFLYAIDSLRYLGVLPLTENNRLKHQYYFYGVPLLSVAIVSDRSLFERLFTVQKIFVRHGFLSSFCISWMPRCMYASLKVKKLTPHPQLQLGYITESVIVSSGTVAFFFTYNGTIYGNSICWALPLILNEVHAYRCIVIWLQILSRHDLQRHRCRFQLSWLTVESIQLAASLGPRFYLNIFKCKQISETGAQQVWPCQIFL